MRQSILVGEPVYTSIPDDLFTSFFFFFPFFWVVVHINPVQSDWWWASPGNISRRWNHLSMNYNKTSKSKITGFFHTVRYTKHRHYEETSLRAPVRRHCRANQDRSSSRGEYEDWGQVSLCAKDDIICTWLHHLAIVTSWFSSPYCPTCSHKNSKAPPIPVLPQSSFFFFNHLFIPTCVRWVHALRVTVRIDFMNVWPIHAVSPLKVSLSCRLFFAFWGEMQRSKHLRSVAASLRASQSIWPRWSDVNEDTNFKTRWFIYP